MILQQYILFRRERERGGERERERERERETHTHTHTHTKTHRRIHSQTDIYQEEQENDKKEDTHLSRQN